MLFEFEPGDFVIGTGGQRHQYTQCPKDPGSGIDLTTLEDTFGSHTEKNPFIPIQSALDMVKQVGLGQVSNKDDPLFILFRIKTLDSNKYLLY